MSVSTINKRIYLILALVLTLPAMVSGAPVSPTGGDSGAPSLAWAILKMVFALGIVLGLLFLTLYFVRRLKDIHQKAHGTNLIKVLATRGIAPKKYISMIEVGGEIMVLGMSDNSVSLLTKMDRAQVIQDTYQSDDKDESGRKKLFRFFEST